MQKGLRPLKNLKFFTGMENYEENNAVPPDKFYNVINSRFDGKVCSSKKGYQAKGNMLVGGTKYQGIYDLPFWNGSATQEALIGFYNKSFYQFGETTQIWNIISTNWPGVADVFTDGIFYNNSLYVVNPLLPGSDGGSGATGHVPFTGPTVGIVIIDTGGSGYTSKSVVLFLGGGGSGATGTLNIVGGVIVGVTVTNGGTGYTSSPSVFFTSGGGDGIGKINLGATGTGANLTANVNFGTITSVSIISGGTGYTDSSPPDLTLSGGGGDGAQISVIVKNGVIVNVNVLNGGSGYTSNPTVTINGVFTVIHGTNGTPRGTMMETWLERIFVAGDPKAPNAWIASKPALAGSPLNVEIFDTTNGAITDILGKSGGIVAMRVLNNDMYMFKNDSVYFNTRNNFAAGQTQFTLLSRTGGATNQKSTIVVENDIWFYDQKNNEIRSLGTERNLGNDPRTKALTEIIKRSMALLDPVQDNPVMSYNKRIVRLSLKTKGSPTNNFTIIFDYNTGGFSIDIGQGINVVTVYTGSVYYGEDSSGQAFQDDSGYTANGAAFPWQADTPFMDDDRPDTFKRARYIYFKGKLSYDQDTNIRLYRDGDYNVFTTYNIPSPRAQGISQSTVMNDGQFGSSQQGNAVWGGSSTDQSDIVTYKIEKLISINQISNLFSLGNQATINGGKVVCEQLILKVIDENENYKRSNI